jgi:N-acetylglucosaminyldiphosphoundecaprenol N-acetyl-beta-D-mannosaminyltransferase
VTPDGMPVVWLGRAQGHREVERTYGPDLMLTLCDFGQARGWRHFFYGGTGDVCAKLVTRLKAKFPNMLVAGVIAPPYIPKAEAASRDVIDAINAARPDILWVALGSPKQDHWMALNRSALDVPVMIGIGAAFDFHAGIKPQAPQWMRRSGLEWIFRLCCEPGRLWKRYIIGNSLFVGWLVCDAFSRRSKR